MDLAMRSARRGSVAASAFATAVSADALQDSLVMELAMRSVSVKSRSARGRWLPVATKEEPSGHLPGTVDCERDVQRSGATSELA
jgi:hypothetical protein